MGAPMPRSTFVPPVKFGNFMAPDGYASKHMLPVKFGNFMVCEV